MTSINTSLEKILVGSKEAARLLSISERKLFDMRMNGEIGFLKQNGRVLFSIEGLKAFARQAERISQTTNPTISIN